MVPTSSPPDLDGLSAWHAGLAQRAGDLRALILTKQNELAETEERLTLVTKLLAVETRTQTAGAAPNGKGAPQAPPISTTVRGASSNMDLEAAVEEILRGAGGPLHISDIRNALMAKGISIPGRGDDANIIVRLRRFEDRFTRTARGTYGLAEWGIPALRSTRRKRRTAAR